MLQTRSFKIGERVLGDVHPCLIIGEVAQSHDGSLGLAHAFIDAIANAGADGVKFQTHIAAAESTRAEPWRVQFSSQDTSRYDYWKRMEFAEEHWKALASHAKDRGLIFLSSPFSIEAVDLLERIGVPGWKVASGELNNFTLLDRIVSTQMPVIVSTGMSALEEIDVAIERITGKDVPIVVMQTTSTYPCPPEKVGLNLLPFFRERYGCHVGLSDHSGTIYPGLAAATIGLQVLEVHVTLSREMFGPDICASITTAELRQLVEGVRFIETMRAHPVNKDLVVQEMEPLRHLFTKSVVAGKDLTAGTILQGEHLAVKKPGTGIPAERLKDIVGRRLLRNLSVDEQLRDTDLK